MTESSDSNQGISWKRGLLSGLISALVAGTCFGSYLYFERFMTGNVLSFLLLGFGWPAFIFTASSKIMNIVTVTAVWFLMGATLGYLTKKKMLTVGLWLIIYIISIAVTSALFAEIMNYESPSCPPLCYVAK